MHSKVKPQVFRTFEHSHGLKMMKNEMDYQDE